MGIGFTEQHCADLLEDVSRRIKNLVDCQASYKHVYRSLENNGITVTHFVGDDPVCSWCISAMPGSDAVVVFHDVYVLRMYHNLGIGALTHDLRLKISQREGARMSMCTVNTSNINELKIIKKFGWDRTTSYSGFDGVVDVYFKHL